MKNYIGSLFGISPVRPLQKHMASVQECILVLPDFFQAVINQDWKEATMLQKKIRNLEQEADKLKKDLRSHLPKSLFLPVSRRDLLEVLTMQDKIANKAKDIAGLILGRKMIFPEEISAKFLAFVARCIDASGQAQQAINELDELVETGFSGGEIKAVQSMLSKLDKIENDTDKIQVGIRASLFKIEQNLPPVEVIFLYTIIDWTGELADISQRVGSRLQLMLAR
ncbi:MAG: TIGR00153 family protein [Gammaproteobacteria bacterium]|nr:TIGR00153 family protein [Gammaproteobacteria bacterium]